MEKLSIGHSTMKDSTAFGVYCLLKKYSGTTVTRALAECDMTFKPIMDSAREREAFGQQSKK